MPGGPPPPHLPLPPLPLLSPQGLNWRFYAKQFGLWLASLFLVTGVAAAIFAQVSSTAKIVLLLSWSL